MTPLGSFKQTGVSTTGGRTIVSHVCGHQTKLALLSQNTLYCFSRQAVFSALT